jgi:hypothetical protein
MVDFLAGEEIANIPGQSASLAAGIGIDGSPARSAWSDAGTFRPRTHERITEREGKRVLVKALIE